MIRVLDRLVRSIQIHAAAMQGAAARPEREFRHRMASTFRHLIERGLTSSFAVHTTEPPGLHTVRVARHSKRWTREDAFILCGPFYGYQLGVKESERLASSQRYILSPVGPVLSTNGLAFGIRMPGLGWIPIQVNV